MTSISAETVRAPQSAAMMPMSQKKRSGGKPGLKTVFDGNTMQTGRLENASPDLNKIKLVIPPGAQVSIKITMRDRTVKNINIQNTGDSDLVARIYLNQSTNEACIAEADTRANKPKTPNGFEEFDENQKRQVLQEPFFTLRKLTLLEAAMVTYVGDAAHGVERGAVNDADTRGEIPVESTDANVQAEESLPPLASAPVSDPERV